MSKWKKWGVLIGAGISSMLVSIDFTVVNTSLVAIQKSLSASIIDLQWFIAAFGIPFCVLLVIFGRLADLFGRRLILYIGMTGFGLASLAAGFSSSSFELIIWRFFLGVFGASIFPCGMALTADVFPKKEYGKALGIYCGLLGVGLAFGPVLGGIITRFLGWNWIFFINIPVILLSFFICIPSVPPSKPNLKQEQIDWLGLILILVGLSALVTWITEGSYLGWLSPFSLCLLLIAILFLIGFYFSEKRTKYPIIPFRFFKHRSFLIGTISNTASISCMWGVIFLIPLYLQSVLNYEITTVGWIILVMTAMTVIAPPIAGRLYDRWGEKKIIFLLFTVLILGYMSMLLFSTTGALWQLFLALILIGIGWGCGNGVSGPLVLSGHHSQVNAGLISGAATTILNIFGVLIIAQSGTLYRFGEKFRLHRLLDRENLSLTSRQEDSIFKVLSEPETMEKVLPGFSGDLAEKILSFFKESFNFGFQVAILFLLVLTVVLAGLMFLVLRKKTMR